MLGKLLKYEFKATGRTFLPLYLAIIVVAFINGLFFKPSGNLNNMQSIGILVLVGLFIALGVLTIVVAVQRFNKNLLGDEGYLMFTLPVSSKSLILSKTIVSTFWCVLSGIVAFMSCVILALVLFLKTSPSGVFKQVDWGLIWEQFKIIIVENNFLLHSFEILLLMIVSYMLFVLTIYLSLSVGQLPKFNNHRKLVGIVTFFVVNIIINYIIVIFVGNISFEVIFENSSLNSIFSSGMWMGILVTIIINIALFFGISYILDKRLNLE